MPLNASVDFTNRYPSTPPGVVNPTVVLVAFVPLNTIAVGVIVGVLHEGDPEPVSVTVGVVIAPPPDNVTYPVEAPNDEAVY